LTWHTPAETRFWVLMTEHTKILILGYTQAGKTTSGDMLAEILGCQPSMACSDILIVEYAAEIGARANDIRANKDTFRVRLYHYGKMRQQDNPIYPINIILEHTSIVTGVRTRQQYDAAKDIFDIILWIKRDCVSRGETDELRPEDADIIIDNNGTFDELRSRLTQVTVR